MDDARDAAIVNTIAEIYSHIAAVESAVAILLKGEVPDDVRRATVEMMAGMSRSALETSNAIREVMRDEDADRACREVVEKNDAKGHSR